MVLAHPTKQRHTVHDKKRHGQHHKPSKHYAKTYWPYLPMLMIVIAGVIINATWQAGKGVLGYATNVSISSLLQETNIQRSDNGQPALSLNSKLSQAAQAKANDMAKRDYWSHTTPDGEQPWQFITAAGYDYTSAAENLAYGFDSSSGTVSGWMNSAGHRANLLNNTYSDVGFGIANAPDYQGDGEETIVVAMYAKPNGIASPSTLQTGRKDTAAAPAANKPTEQQQAAPEQTTPTPVVEQAQPEVKSQQAVVASTPKVEDLKARQVSRLDVLTEGNAQWAALAASVLASLAFMSLLLSHAKVWKRYLIRGEEFFIKHPLLDTVFVAVATFGFLLTRTSGFIH